MTAQVENLASLMKAKKERGEKFVVMLGAGASITSGVKPTAVMMQELLEKYGRGLAGTTLEDRFDELWKQTSKTDRGTLLEPYLDLQPAPGYEKLARLIRAGYFDVLVTFNFDDLLEKALKGAEFVDYKVIIRGETIEQEMQKLVDAKEPRFKLVKLHGSLRSSDHFLFDSEEMSKYPDPVKAVVNRITEHDIIVCGYAFADQCVRGAFAEQGDLVVSVDPAGPPRGLKIFLKNRRSENWSIRAGFDDFFGELNHELLEPRTVAAKPLLNPFKFLESYDDADKGSLTGREEETDDFVRALEKTPHPRVIVVAGPGKAGKTSLTKAVLLPGLDPQKYRGIYVRCQANIAESLPRDLTRLGFASVEADVAATLRGLGKASPNEHVVLFLDQFDRVTSRYNWRTKAGSKELGAFLRDQLFTGCNEALTLVLIVTDEGSLGGTLLKECGDEGLPASLVPCLAFDKQAVVDIVRALAKKGEINFDSQIIEQMAQQYEQYKDAPAPENRFTLAHVHAVCHILAGTRQVNYDSYEAFKANMGALHQAINVCDIISFVEDFAWSDAVWLRNIIKVPLKESKDKIAQFLKEHYEELLPQASAQGRRRQSGPQGAGRQA